MCRTTFNLQQAYLFIQQFLVSYEKNIFKNRTLNTLIKTKSILNNFGNIKNLSKFPTIIVHDNNNILFHRQHTDSHVKLHINIKDGHYKTNNKD